MEDAPHRGWATIKEKHILKSDFHNGRSREHLTSVSLRCPRGVRTKLKTLQHQRVLWRNSSEVPQIHTPYLSLIPILRTSSSPPEWLWGSFCVWMPLWHPLIHHNAASWISAKFWHLLLQVKRWSENSILCFYIFKTVYQFPQVFLADDIGKT